jgi:hypothetical protein
MPITENFNVEYEDGRSDHYTLQRRGSQLAVACDHYDRKGYLIHGVHRRFCKGDFFGKNQLAFNLVTERDFFDLRDLLLQIAD